MKPNSLFYRAFDYLWSLFLNGLLLLLPVAITASIFSFTFRFIKSWLSPLRDLNLPYIDLIPHGEVFLVLAIIVATGFLVRTILLKTCMDIVDNILKSIPVIQSVYTGVKQLVHAFSPQDDNTFKKVVLVEFPRKGVYSIGFLTSELYKEISPDTATLYNIFVPTTPNPTSGFFVAVPAHDFIVTKLTRQEAMALIISGGIIQPERFKNI